MTSFVYVMTVARGPLCKVGFSIDPAKRAKAVSADIGEAVSVYASVPCADDAVRLLERATHAYLSAEDLHDHLEWFRASPREAMWAIYRAQRRLSHRLRRRPRETTLPLFDPYCHLMQSRRISPDF